MRLFDPSLIDSSRRRRKQLVGQTMNLSKKVASRWIQARIILPPRDIDVYLKTIKRKLLPLEKYIDKLMALDKKYNRNFKDSWGDNINPMEDFEFYGNDWDEFLRNLSRLNPKYRQAKSYISETFMEVDEQLGWSRKDTTAQERLKWMTYIVKSFERLQNKLEDAKLHKYNSSEDGLLDWSNEEEFYKKEGIPFPSVQEILLILEYEENLQKAQTVLKKAIERFKRINEQAYGYYYDREWKPPEIEDVETLYHATIHAKTLARTGFSLKVPKTEGIGGAQGDRRGRPAISFTSDLYVANQVARALKEAVMIAKGKLKYHQVRDWAKREGIEGKVDYAVKTQDDISDPIWKAFNYYSNYLDFSKRYNPVFFGINKSVMNVWKRTNESNIGVIAAEINMAEPNIKYLPSMQEYRVPPEAVIKITKLIR